MLVFVIPLKGREFSKSWERVCNLFARCIKSVCNQTSPDFRVIVVCNEQPEIDFHHPNITYLTVDLADYKEPLSVNRGRTDKGRKILKGLVYAQQFAPTHTMALDADDCISNKIAEFVKNNPESNGWFINQGYKYQEGSDYIYIKRNNFYRMCGSCNILRYDLNFLPEPPEYNRGYGYYKYYIDHAKVKDTLIEKSQPISPLPFPGAIYILETGENHYYDPTKLTFSIFNRKKITPSIRDEFGLYKLQ
jgi:hypothetical protein